ncbi:allantoate amidohydrolase [Arthrobacter crystallopoietes BAB-32]|uniref:Allantoate amidohydrolase n=1 Tax=Arthrobacter crystallopoietes BAB-32 TaxID=1246476 RepID=N1V505_9MICC|nr:M20 family metallo-hydrolase [Arthrobacter crystallopoietes]EMY33303.1 allantoate amidohydrolase [Arthrobacter crystallopoietes BAB-32]
MTVTIDPDASFLDSALADLATYTDDSFDGWTREVLSDPYRASREVVANRMRQAGMEVHIDAGGNVVGRLPGRAAASGVNLKPLMTGSHTDTVRNGGRFDGIVGVLGAIEAVEALRRAGIELERDLVVVDFLGEEPNEFGISCMGSRSMAGVLTPEHLELPGTSGITLGKALERYGVDPNRALKNSWGPDSVHAYIELHIEQGPMLERAGTQIGVVTAIAGIDRLLARFTGRADHAGATPMDARQDALTCAAAAVLAVEREGCGAPVHGVATTGRIEAFPGSFNVVPQEARIYAELRSTDAAWLNGAKRRVADEIAAEAERRGVAQMVEWLTDQDPVPTTPALRDHIAAASGDLGLSWMAVPSGAGHDAAHMVHMGPMGMIFIPSVGGRSHCPEEFTDTRDIVEGVRVLAATLVRLDRTDKIAA